MTDSFDYIAIPKGKAPGGPVQASDGTWYVVTPMALTFAGAKGRRLTYRRPDAALA